MISFSYRKNPGDMSAVVAQLSLIQEDPGEARMLVTKFDIHPDYDPITRVNDIALVKVFSLFHQFIFN